MSIDFWPTKEQFAVGERVVFRAMATNRAREAIYIVPQIDGMHSGRRAPVAQIEVRSKQSKWSVPRAVGCGNTNPLRQQDFIRVPAGAQVDLLAGMVWSHYEVGTAFLEPGDYEARFIYDTTAPLERWIGGPLAPENAARLCQLLNGLYLRVPKVRVISEPVRIKVVSVHHS